MIEGNIFVFKDDDFSEKYIRFDFKKDYTMVIFFKALFKKPSKRVILKNIEDCNFGLRLTKCFNPDTISLGNKTIPREDFIESLVVGYNLGYYKFSKSNSVLESIVLGIDDYI